MRNAMYGLLVVLGSGTNAGLADEIKLPVVPGAADPDKNPGPVVCLNVNERGRVLLPPSDQINNTDGTVTDTLDNAEQVYLYLNRRAKAEARLNPDNEEPQTVLLWTHAGCSFEQVYAITKTARRAGHTQSHWRVDRGADKGEGRLPVALVRAGEKPEVEFVARVTATDEGKVEKILLTGDGLPKDGLDLKTDVAAFGKKLADLAAVNKGKRIGLRLEIGDKLLQAHVVQLIDASIRADIADVSPVPIDPKKR